MYDLLLFFVGNQALNGFRLEVYWDWDVPKGRYRFWCVEGPLGWKSEEDNTGHYMDGSLQSLTKVPIKCTDQHPYIQTIHMWIPNGGEFRYSTRCFSKKFNFSGK